MRRRQFGYTGDFAESSFKRGRYCRRHDVGFGAGRLALT